MNLNSREVGRLLVLFAVSLAIPTELTEAASYPNFYNPYNYNYFKPTYTVKKPTTTRVVQPKPTASKPQTTPTTPTPQPNPSPTPTTPAPQPSTSPASTLPAAYASVAPSFQEEFSGSDVDTRKWNKTFYWGGRNNSGTGELQYYADNAFSCSNGIMSIKADNKPSNGYKYTSGLLTTYNKFSQQYGYFEMRAKLPKGKGLWPAFWLLPVTGAWPPEIDVMEMLGDKPTTTFLTHHFLNSSNQHDSAGTQYVGPNLTSDFHTFGVDWRPNSITWYVDGVERYKVTKNIPSGKMYILANMAIGGGGWTGTPDASTPFPSYMQIDYIRAYPYTGQ